ncbi:hypothetical protein ACWGR4_07900 [Embleya sp. NPDC055664]
MDGPAGEPKAPTGLRERKKARTRQAISTVAFDLFEEQGFEQTTVDMICRRHAMTVSHGNLEDHAEQTARRHALRRRFLGVRSVHDHGVALIDTVAHRIVTTTAARLGVDPAVDLRPHALGALVAAMTRRVVIDDIAPGPINEWAEAFRTLLPTPAAHTTD